MCETLQRFRYEQNGSIYLAIVVDECRVSPYVGDLQEIEVGPEFLDMAFFKVDNVSRKL
jgi:hypothetical protein